MASHRANPLHPPDHSFPPMFVVRVDCSPAAGDTHVAVSKSYLHVLCTDSDTQQGQTTDMTTTHFLRAATLLAGTGMTAAAFCDDYAASV